MFNDVVRSMCVDLFNKVVVLGLDNCYLVIIELYVGDSVYGV